MSITKKVEFQGVKDKPRTVFSKFKPEEFWQYINPNNSYVYELRIRSPRKGEKTYPYIKEIAHKFRLPSHFTGVFVKNAEEFWRVACYAYKRKLTLYISANPKRKSWHPKTLSRGECYNGMMQSEERIAYLLIDFDPTSELKELGSDESMEACYRIAKKFLEGQRNIKNYCLLGSGNGVQIRIRLDTPIQLPKAEYDEDWRFIITDEWAVYSRLCKEAMAPILQKYETEHVKADLTSLELARVGRAPFSGNWKNLEHPSYAGLIEVVEDGENEGLYDFLISKYEQVARGVTAKKEYSDEELAAEFVHDARSIRDSKLARLLLTPDLPAGGRNNVLFFQFKLLLKANNLSANDPDVARLIRDIERVQRDSFPTNEPAAHMRFHPEAVVNYCLTNKLPPIYDPLYYVKKQKRPKLEKEYLRGIKVGASHEGTPALPKENGITRAIQKFVTQHDIRWDNQYHQNKDIAKLLRAIQKSTSPQYLSYLIDYDVLPTILAKI